MVTIYVDFPRDWKGKNGKVSTWRHLYTDPTDSKNLYALHRFARKIGLRSRWYQKHHLLPHYDLKPAQREKAIEAGAVELSVLEFLRQTKLHKRLGGPSKL